MNIEFIKGDIMPDETKTESTVQPKKKIPTIAIVGIGCLGLLMLVGIGISIAGRVIFSKFGANLVKQGIESKTGVKIDTSGKNGALSLTDSKTGESVNIGDQKIPDNFPKDFPIYPGAKPSGSLSGNNQKEQSQGFWIVLQSNDNLDKVKSFYADALTKNGWTIDNTMTINDMSTYTVKKGNLSGGVTVSRGKDDKQTTITVTLATEILTEPPAESPVSEPNM
jgi:hypothetical protein